MSGDPRKLEGLLRLSEAVCQKEQANLAAISAEEAGLRRVLDDLEHARRHRARDLSEGPDAARLAGMDPPWEQWIDRRTTTLTQERARVRARKETARQAFGLAYGRKEAVGELLARARRARQARRNDHS